MNKKLLGDRVLIEPDKEQKTSSGIVIKKDEEMGDFMTGIVKEVGVGRQTDYGFVIKPSVSVGEKVLFQYGKKIKIEDKIYLVVSDADIIRIM
ncbi:MAG: co-chaperone GroES [Nanoarchaeota archaeon]